MNAAKADEHCLFAILVILFILQICRTVILFFFLFSQATEGITSTSFEIARPATIKSDNTGHKVSICQIELKPDFEYVTVPKLVAHAFLKAKVKNESPYALLAGDSNVFLDNNFLTKVRFRRSYVTKCVYNVKL